MFALADQKRVRVIGFSGRMVMCEWNGKRRAFDASAITMLWGERA